MDTHDDPLLDQGAAAAILGRSHRTLEGWRCRGYGPRYIRVGGAVRYRQSDLDRWLRQQTVDPQAAA